LYHDHAHAKRWWWLRLPGAGIIPPMQPSPTPPTPLQDLVAQALAEAGPFETQQQERYLREILTTVVRLMRDNASTGDLKIINTALKERRHAFKVFAPYRHIRKVSAFGSARTKETD